MNTRRGSVGVNGGVFALLGKYIPDRGPMSGASAFGTECVRPCPNRLELGTVDTASDDGDMKNAANGFVLETAQTE